MSSAEIKSLAESTQLLVANNTALRADNIHVQVYRGYPDMAQVEEINRRFKSGETMPDYAPDSFLGFLFSKPSIAKDNVTIHVLYALDKDGKPINQIWLKLKSNASLQNVFNQSDNNTPLAEINVQQLQQEIFAQLKIPAPNLETKATLIKQGPLWLDTPIVQSDNKDKTLLTLPIVETPLGVAERFAGHFYIKLLTAFNPAN